MFWPVHIGVMCNKIIFTWSSLPRSDGGLDDVGSKQVARVLIAILLPYFELAGENILSIALEPSWVPSWPLHHTSPGGIVLITVVDGMVDSTELIGRLSHEHSPPILQKCATYCSDAFCV